MNCCTRDNKTLDSDLTCYMQTQQAPTAHHPSPLLGRSDHNLVHLLPVYTPMVKRQPPNKRRVKQWSEEASDALRDCFDTTDWEVLCGPHEQDIDSLTDCITDYINFCVETTVPTKRVQCFSNNKPWVTPDLRALLLEKKRAFQSGDRDELRRVQRDLKAEDQRVQGQLQEENGGPPAAKQREGAPSACTPPHHHQHLHHLWGSHHPPRLHHHLYSAPLLHPLPSPNLFTPTVDQVRTQLKKIKARKATGPDDWISSRLLRDCADQLCQVVCYIFNLSLSLERVPVLCRRLLVWFQSLKLRAPGAQPLQSPTTSDPWPNMDPLQFIYLLQRSLSHLEDAGNTMRITFFDFSSAFNTIHPSLLRVKLERAGASDQLAAWVTNYLTDRPQFVRLFTLYTSDFTYSTDSCHLQKFSDDTAIVGCVSEGNDCEYRKVIMDFVDWCELNHLQVNASNLGVHLNNKLDWTDNTDSLYKRGQSRLYMLRRLGSFGVCRPLLRTFYETVVASVVSYPVVCWRRGVF
ncbi:hypothetical protein L3Q82_017659 [Scortum barcoo]|uniref:Uncharacterized protein n=1 Tax=Scortum barcoo TaxID=214431 RepID=A0ACB8VLI0_9TELE|nr:hypothetical protein L3Q82_017659 [Scortum barcoo]